jgi:hypothetical protein
MNGGFDRLIARVAHGRQDVRPLAPTLFENDEGHGETWEGEQSIEVPAEPLSDATPSALSPPPGAIEPQSLAPAKARPQLRQILHEAPAARQPSLPEPKSTSTEAMQAADGAPVRRVSLDRHPRADPERSARSDPERPPMERYAIPRADPAPAPVAPAPQSVLVETIEHNNIVIEIGRIEVKAPPAAPAAQPAPSAPAERHGPRLTLEAYLERKAAGR